MILDFSQNGLTVIFEVTEDKAVLLKHFAFGQARDDREKKAKYCPLVEIGISGENIDDHHGFKHTGTSGGRGLKYASHSVYTEKDGKRVAFLLTDGRMRVTVNYRFYNGIAAVRAWTEVENIGAQPIGLEYVSSFAYTGLDDGASAALEQPIRVAVGHNGTVREANWQWYDLQQLGLRRISSSSTKRYTVSNTGSWSAKEYLPMGCVQNLETDKCWLWQIESCGSWQWELSELDRMLYLRLSGPTEQENHWYKALKPGERFESVKVCLTAAEDFNGALAEMTKYRRAIFQNNAENAAMPVIFNDYMNCLWADPTEEKELPLVDLAAAAGAEYYCMDAGWYADGTWWETVGEWQPCAWRFPNGIKRVFDYIREKGMIPGIWLELEVMGINCPLAQKLEDTCFFMRHGKRVIDHGRYQLDFRHPKVRAHADAVVDRVIREYGVGYIKMDYNIEAGIGTEVDADSFGAGLLEHNRAYLAWLEEIKEKYPHLIWENCSSGGMRMDYAMLERAHLQSVTDQTDYKKMASIAAAAPTAALPEQAAIWAYPLADADKNAAAFNMVNAMLQRIHLSGKIADWSEEVRALVREGIQIYKSYRHLISSALPFYPLGLPDYHAGWLCLALQCADRTLVAVWRMDSESDRIQIPLRGATRACVLYPTAHTCTVCTENEGVAFVNAPKYSAVLLEIHGAVIA